MCFVARSSETEQMARRWELQREQLPRVRQSTCGATDRELQEGERGKNTREDQPGRDTDARPSLTPQSSPTAWANRDSLLTCECSMDHHHHFAIPVRSLWRNRSKKYPLTHIPHTRKTPMSF